MPQRELEMDRRTADERQNLYLPTLPTKGYQIPRSHDADEQEEKCETNYDSHENTQPDDQ